jgi:hypothetical protein
MSAYCCVKLDLFINSVYEVSFFLWNYYLNPLEHEFCATRFESPVPASRETYRLSMAMIDALILCADVQDYILRIKQNTYTSAVFSI